MFKRVRRMARQAYKKPARPLDFDVRRQRPFGASGTAEDWARYNAGRSRYLERQEQEWRDNLPDLRRQVQAAAGQAEVAMGRQRHVIEWRWTSAWAPDGGTVMVGRCVACPLLVRVSPEGTRPGEYGDPRTERCDPNGWW